MVGGGTTELDDKYAMKQISKHRAKKNIRRMGAFFGDIARGTMIEQSVTSTGTAYNKFTRYLANNSALYNDPTLNNGPRFDGKEFAAEAMTMGSLFGIITDVYLIGMAAGILGEQSELATGVLATKGLGILAYQGTRIVKEHKERRDRYKHAKMLKEKFPQLENSDLEKITNKETLGSQE